MSMTFTKLFSSITESTIWVEDNETRIVWIAMLAMADRKGRVWGSIPGLANRARVSVDGCRKAIQTFLSPDPDSRTKEEEGRRIREIDGGWQLINYLKYREIRDQESVREQTAKRVAAHRKRNVTRVTRGNTNEEAEAEAYNGSTNVDPNVWMEFTLHRKAIRKPLSKLSAEKNRKVLEALTVEQQRACVDATIANNWTGLFPPKVSHGSHQGNTPTSAGDRVRAATAKREADARAAGADY